MAEMIDRALRLEGLLPPDRTPYMPEQSFPREKRAAVVPSNPDAMSAQTSNVEHPPAFESAVDWCKRHLAGLDQAKVEAKPTFDKKRDLPNVHAWERDVVAPGNAAAVKPAAVVKVTQLETGSSRCSVGNPDKTANQVRCLRCSEWGHAVSKCPLSLAPMQSYLAKQRSANPVLCARREADQKPGQRVVAHSNTEEASRAVCGPWGVLACKGRDKWLPKEPIQHVGENQQSSAGRVRSPMTTRVEVVPGERSCRRDLPQRPHKEPCAFLPAGNHQERNALEKSRPVPCLECGQLGHEMLSCPRFWGAPGGNDVEPVSCENIFAVTPGNKEEFSVVSAGGAISSRGHQGELASKCVAEDCLRQRTQMKMVTPTTAVGKTVFNEMMSGTADCRYKRTGYETVHDDVRVTPVSGATKCVLEDYFSLQSGNAGVKVQTEPVLMTKSVVSNVCQSQVGSGLGQPAKTKNAISVIVNEKFAAVGKIPGSFRAKAVVTNGPLPVATDGKTAQLSPEISRELHVLKSEVAMDNWYVTLVGQSGTVPCNGNVLVQAASTKNVQVNGGLKQHVKNAKVCEAYEAPPEQGGGGCGVLQPVVLEHVLPKSAMICNLGNESATKSICSNVCPWADGSGLRSTDEWSTATTDWDSWGKNLMSLIDEAFMHKSKVDKVSAVPAGGMAEQLIPEGVVAVAGVNPREKYGPHKGEHTADTLSATYKNDADVACQSDVVNGNVKQFIGAEPEKLSVSQAPGSALVEHQAVVISSWEKVSLNLATSCVSAIESVCIPSVRKVPRKDFNPKPRVWFLTKVLKEMLKLWDVQPVYTGVSPPQSDSLVLRSTIRWTPEWQVVQHKGRQDKNGLFMTVLLVLKVASRYADGLLPVQEVYGRGFGEKKVSEVSPPNSQVEGISAAMVQDSTGQLSLKGVYTVPVVLSHEMGGPNVDQKAAEILTVAQPKVVKVTGVPSPMFGLGDKRIRSAVKIVCGSDESLSLQVDKNTNGIRTSQVVGQLPAERVNPGEVTSSEVPVGDGNPLVCVPSADSALANTEKKGIGDFCNIERCKVGLNMYINDEPNNLLKVHDSVVSKGIGKPGNLKRGGRRVGRNTRVDYKEVISNTKDN
ncbi:uncharacterized protein LOC120941244 [Rana temporaria]|uniref:uncharacterized protein LOC120941244 n=1 Tax=Rana temporaria TaxID=8407 RepID=UPI001AADCD62|nr:uncharacterized protein LOC120941244 [Rana temporaria]